MKLTVIIFLSFLVLASCTTTNGPKHESKIVLEDCNSLLTEYPVRSANTACKQYADDGNVHAQIIIGLKNLYLESTTKNHIEGLEYLTKAAESGNPDAAFLLGFAFQKPSVVYRNLTQSRYWLEVAIEKDREFADMVLSTLLLNQEDTSEKDIELSVNGLFNGSLKGNYEGYYLLGLAQLYGIGTEQNIDAAYDWFDKYTSVGEFRVTNELLWFLATSISPESSKKFYPLKFIDKFFQEPYKYDPFYIDTLAAVYASIDDYQNAVHYQEKAINLLQRELTLSVLMNQEPMFNNEDLIDLRSRLDLYQSNKRTVLQYGRAEAQNEIGRMQALWVIFVIRELVGERYASAVKLDLGQ